MSFKEIKIDSNISYYKTKLDNIDNSLLIKDLKLNMNINKHTSVQSPKEPGVQSHIIIKTKTIEKLNQSIYDLIFKLLKYEKNEVPYFTTEWVYVSDKNNKYSRFHTHAFSSTLKKDLDWTFVYYVQIPDIVNDNEGKLFFKTTNGAEFEYVPEEGDLLLFSANLLHKPEINPNSIKERIVYAGSFVLLDYEYDYNKNKKVMI